METNLTASQFPETLSEPHFDEEATVLARPVVPLKEVAPIRPISQSASQSGVRPAWFLKRAWVFGLMLTGALLLGMGATAFYYSRVNRVTATPLTENETISSGSSGATAQVPEVKAEPRVRVQNPIQSDTAEKARTEVATTIEPAPARPEISNKPVARRVAVITFGRGSQDDEQVRDERRAARREAKEQRRERRQNEDNKSSDQLLRIREIFEGPRKP